MLGWLSELKSDLNAAERYYCYAIQLDPIDTTYFLMLQQLITDTLEYVRGLSKSSEKKERKRIETLKKKLKIRRKGISVPIGEEGDENGTQAAALILIRRRLILHERVSKCSGRLPSPSLLR